MKCSWCGKEIVGEPFSRATLGPMVWGDGEVEVDMTGGHDAVFCCAGCEWAYELDFHRLLGMDGKEARQHLIKVHELHPDRPSGRQSRESWNRSSEIAKVMFRVMTGEDPGSPGSGN